MKHFKTKSQYVEFVTNLSLIALTWLINVLKVFVAGVVGQFNFLDIPAFATRCLENKNHVSRGNIMGSTTFLLCARIRLLEKVKSAFLLLPI